MSIPSVVIIWCDVSFETRSSYQAMQDEFNETTTGASAQEPDRMDVDIVNDGTNYFHSNNVPLIVTRTIEEAETEIKNHSKEKIFIICSGTIGRFLVPIISQKFFYVHDIFIFTHGLERHTEWTAAYKPMVKMFRFHTTLLIRLTHEITKYFIKQGNNYLQVDDGSSALKYFKHAQKLEIEANKRSKTTWNAAETYSNQPDYRRHLNVLEGHNGLIAQAENSMRRQGLPVPNY
ncbi:unnamed protein product [Adineta ricciae]|uniref:Uncharacterized protein n=1 Tax=Adineta ricciae TaxID=249248 RepID=A0A814ZDA7_ADIRI|nr:unnamed protein product [Adineta ricciae]CAF1242549.1 unnamed protein product [Adineta ricciae]